MTANCLDECGTLSPLDVSFSDTTGLGEYEEYWEEGERVLELVLAGRAGMVWVASFGESPRVMNEETSGGNCIRLSCLSLLGIAEGSNVDCDAVGGETTGGVMAGECLEDWDIGSVCGV
jgi:hypothetical protein